MNEFQPLGPHSLDQQNEASFWPSFTDIMMVVVLIFLLTTSLLLVRNWHLVAELQQSMEAEKLAAQMAETTSQENATLEERLTNAEQLNTILRLRLLEKEEQLKKSAAELEQKLTQIAALEVDKDQLRNKAEDIQQQLMAAMQDIERISAESQDFANQLAEQRFLLEQQQTLTENQRLENEQLRQQVASLSTETEQNRQTIEMLETERDAYNQQLLSLQGDYEVVKSKYEELIKPARSAKGKYVAEVYYVKKQGKSIYRFKEPGDSSFTDHTLRQIESKLDALKQEKGEALYVKIIIPKDSGLTYNEAWGFMKDLLDKYDYYYQDPDNNL